MTSPRDRFFALSPGQRRVVHERLAEQALARWKAYSESQGEIRYRETVCGTEQTVDAALPADALAAVRSGEGVAAVAERYAEPMAALQDGDLSFPEPIAYAYYAVYNLFRRYALHEDLDDWLLVNQAGSSEADEGKWDAALTRAIGKALERAT